MKDELSATRVVEIIRLHSEIMEGVRTTLDKAIRIGELLALQKAKVEHGDWLPWIEKHLTFDRATAANYMRVWDRREELKCKSVLHLTEAYRLLASPRSTTPPQPPSSTDRLSFEDVLLVAEITVFIFTKRGWSFSDADRFELIGRLVYGLANFKTI